MKSFTRINIAILYIVSLSLFVLSLGSVLMAAPKGTVPSPLVGANSILAQAQANAQARQSLPHTYADWFAQPKLNAGQAATGRGIAAALGPNVVAVTSTVQTTDITLPTYPPTVPLDATTGFPTAATPTNIDPIWSHNAAFLVFASNRNITNASTGAFTVTTNFHLFAIAASGDPSTLVQLTTGSGNERWPTLLGPNDNQISFCESASPSGSYTLEQANLGVGASGTLQVSSISPFVSLGLPTDIEHPSYGSGFIAFSGGANPAAVHHIYTINVGSGAVTQLTSGSADERNPACSQVSGNTLIAFQSNATSYTGSITNPPQVSAGTQALNNIFVVYFLGTVTPQRVSNGPVASDNIDPAWSISPNANCSIVWSSSNRIDLTTASVDSHYGIVYLPTTVDSSGQFLDNVENNSSATDVNVSDTAHNFDNFEPTATDPQKNDSIAYTTNRYLVNGPNDNPTPGTPLLDVEPAEEATTPSASTTGPTLELFESHTVDNTPPSLLNYSNSEIVHIEDTNNPGVPVRNAIAPGDALKFTVRMSDRQYGLKSIYLQIKDPNSKYQDPFGLEHRVYSRPGNFNDESATLWTGAAVGGFNGASPIELGNAIPFNGATTSLTAAITVTTTPATSMTVASTAGMAVGDELTIDPGQPDHQTVFLLGFTTTPGQINTSAINGSHGVGTPVKDIATFNGEGQEVDCEAVNLADTSVNNSFDATNPSDFLVPGYTPSFEDGIPNSGNAFAPQTYWLQLTPDSTQDGNGGITYSATWTTPKNYPSDYYIDVVGYDQAVTPKAGTSSPVPVVTAPNWLIYDNVWGFSTAPQPTPSGASVLVVNDYGLPQKFFSRFNTPGNVPINFYGAESYITDLNVNVNDVVTGKAEAVAPHIGLSLPPPGQTGNAVESALLSDWNFNPGSNPPLNPGYANGLGVNSYVDSQQSNVALNDGAPAAPSQNYVIWRILSRGPLPQQTLLEFAPLQGSMPNPSNPSQQTPVLVANSCVLWISPFTGDEFVAAGTLDDPNTQASLDAYLNAGGRLEIEGIDIGNALNNGGTSSFYTNDLHATFVTDAVGYNAQTIILTGSGNAADFLSHDAYIDNNNQLVQLNGIGHGGFALPLAGPPGIVYTPPSKAKLTIGNFGIAGVPGSERSDASMNASNDELGFIDGFNAGTGALSELFGTVGGKPADQFILVQSDTNGGKLIYGSFGLEAVSQEVVPFTPMGATEPDFVSVNQRTNLIHNVICDFRTGQIFGKVVSTGTGGAGVGGALVEASAGGASYTAFTDNTGAYTIVGMPPGDYAITVSKGSAHANGTSLFVHGGDLAGPVNVVINPPQPGGIKVTVVDPSGNPISGVTVTATETPGGDTLPTQTTNTNGIATFSNVSPGTYNIVADGSAVGFSVSPPVQTTVTSGNTSTVKITLQPGPGTVYGIINGLPNGTTATVSVIDSNGHVVASSSTVPIFNVPSNSLGFDGGQADYEVKNVPAGTYSVSASVVGFVATPVSTQPFTLQAGHGKREDFSLAAASQVHVLGLVTDNVGNPITGATVTFTDANNVHHTVITTAPVTVGVAIGGQTQFNYGVDPSGTPNFTLLQGSYTAQATAAGLNPTPQILVQIQTDPTVQDFEGTNGLQTLHTFQAGLTFFSVPFDYSTSGMSLSQIFGYNNPTLAVWNTAISQYAISPTPPANTITLGQGYWARFPGVEVLAPGGTPASTLNPFAITLKPGWNMIGDPFFGPVNMAAFQVSDGHGHTFTWAQATANNIHMLNPILYSYNTSTGQYDQHYVGSTVGKPADLFPTMDPYAGYWIQAFTTSAIQIAPPPLAPSGLLATTTVVNTKPAVSLTWTAVAGATSYNIYRSTTAGAEVKIMSGVATNAFTDTTVTTGTTYFYEVTAASAAGESLKSNEVSASP